MNSIWARTYRRTHIGNAQTVGLYAGFGALMKR